MKKSTVLWGLYYLTVVIALTGLFWSSLVPAYQIRTNDNTPTLQAEIRLPFWERIQGSVTFDGLVYRQAIKTDEDYTPEGKYEPRYRTYGQYVNLRGFVAELSVYVSTSKDYLCSPFVIWNGNIYVLVPFTCNISEVGG